MDSSNYSIVSLHAVNIAHVPTVIYQKRPFFPQNIDTEMEHPEKQNQNNENSIKAYRTFDFTLNDLHENKH